MPTSYEKVCNYYHQFDEWQRLNSPSGQLERVTVVELISRYLTDSCHIMDLGSGPGRYAAEFCQLGHRVTLADISSTLISEARLQFARNGLEAEQFIVANATDLHMLHDDEYDAVFCAGPFYHLVEATERLEAAKEVLRICKPGGKLIIGFMPLASGLAGLLFRASTRSDQVAASNFTQAHQTGAFINHSGDGFQEGFFADASSFQDFWSDLGVTNIRVYSSRSFMHQQEQAVSIIQAQNPDLYSSILSAHFKCFDHPAYVSMGGHAFLVGHHPV